MGELFFLVAISSLLLVAAVSIPMIATIIPRCANKILGKHAKLTTKDKIKLGLCFYVIMGLLKFIEMYFHTLGNIYWPVSMIILDAVFWPFFIALVILQDTSAFYQYGILKGIVLFALSFSLTQAIAIRMIIKKSRQAENSSS